MYFVCAKKFTKFPLDNFVACVVKFFGQMWRNYVDLHITDFFLDSWVFNKLSTHVENVKKVINIVETPTFGMRVFYTC